MADRAASILDRHQRSWPASSAIVILMTLHRSYDIRRHHLRCRRILVLRLGLREIFTVRISRLRLARSADAPAHLGVAGGRPGPGVTGVGMSLHLRGGADAAGPGGLPEGVRRQGSLLAGWCRCCSWWRFFPGALLYPLSDLPALLLALGGLYVALAAWSEPTAPRFLGMLLPPGCSWGRRYNTRTIYLFVPVGLLGPAGPAGRPCRGPRHYSALARTCGVRRRHDRRVGATSGHQPAHPRGVQPGRPGARRQPQPLREPVGLGHTVQRYETTIDRDAPSPTGVLSRPRRHTTVRGGGRPRATSSRSRYYFKVVAEHPLHFLSLYTRHVINGLDVRDGCVTPGSRRPCATARRCSISLVLALARCVACLCAARSMRPAPAFEPVPTSMAVFLVILLLPGVGHRAGQRSKRASSCLCTCSLIA